MFHKKHIQCLKTPHEDQSQSLLQTPFIYWSLTHRHITVFYSSNAEMVMGDVSFCLKYNSLNRRNLSISVALYRNEYMYWDTQKHYSITLLIIATQSACAIRAINSPGRGRETEGRWQRMQDCRSRV